MSGLYDPDKLNFIYGGYRLSGFAEGSHVSISRAKDLRTATEGVDGEVAVVKTNSRLVEITLRLAQSSDTNRLLSQLAKEEDRTNGVRTLSITDLSGGLIGGSLFVASAAWIKKDADGAFEDAAAAREWVFEAIIRDMDHAGLAFVQLV